MFSTLEQQLVELATVIPLPGFVFIASFIEEVIAPIPSPFVMLVAGSLARVQDLSVLSIALIILIATLGKTLGALTVYGIVRTAETSILDRYPKFFGITVSDIDAFRTKLSGTPRDYIVLTVLRALPIIPSVLLSAGGGFLKLPIRLFVVTTILGTIVRDALYLYAGYMGTQTLAYLVDTSSHLEKFVYLGVAIIIGYCLARHLRARRGRVTPPPEV